jgi:hypothetical protein
MMYAYFLGIDMKEALTMRVPEHTVVKLLPNQYGWTETHFQLLYPSAYPQKPGT